MDPVGDLVERLRREMAEDPVSVDEHNAWKVTNREAAATSPPNGKSDPSGTQQGGSTVFNAEQHLATGCAVPGCDVILREDLSRCTGCRVAVYCGKEHQHVDRPAHRSVCSTIKLLNLAYKHAERRLREEKGDDVFTNGPPHFWAIHETRPYLRARFALVEALLLVNTEEAVETALHHLLAMLRLCHSDKMRGRYLVPALYLRLRRDQEAYDFCKWWVTTAQEESYDWGNKSNRYLDVQDSDPFEDPKAFICEASASVSFTVSVTLIKVRLLIDLQALQRDKQVALPKLPSEITDQALVYCTSSIVKAQRKMLEVDDQTLNMTMLRRQIRQLFEAVTDSDERFWPAIVGGGSNVEAMVHGSGDTGVLKYNYNAWAETKGAIDVVEELLEQK